MKDYTEKDIVESVRKRPAMYLGSNGVNGISKLFCGLIIEFIELTENGNIDVTIELNEKSNSIKFKSKESFSPFLNQLNPKSRNIYFFHFYCLKYLSKEFEIVQEENLLELKFKLNYELLKVQSHDYYDVLDELKHTAILNRDCSILIKEKNGEYENQNYLKYPNGIKRYYDEVHQKVLGTPKIEIHVDKEFSDFQLQFVFAYRTDWYPEPTILSFANSKPTINHDSIVEGIRNGFFHAIEKWISEKEMNDHIPEKDKMDNGLILISQLKSPKYKSYENYKDVDDQNIENEIEEYIRKVAFYFFESNPESVENFCQRFNQNSITNGIFKKKATDNNV